MAIDYDSKEYKRYKELEEKKEELRYEFDRTKEMIENPAFTDNKMYSIRLRELQQEYANVEAELKKNTVAKEFNEMDKRERKRKFKEIKEKYKNGSKTLPLIDRITSRRPKWGKIKKYNMEQLDYLLEANKGETYRGGLVGNEFVDKIKEEAERYVERYYPDLSFNEKRKLVDSKIFNNFQKLLQNERLLDDQIENSKEGRSL